MTRGDAVSLVEQYERDRQDAAADNNSTEQTDRFERPSPTHEMLSPGAVATIGGSRRSRASRAAPGDGAFTAADLRRLEAVYQESADRIIRALLALAAEHRCNTPEVVNKVLNSVNSETLERCGAASIFAAHLEVALRGSDPQGNRSLQLVENPPQGNPPLH